jgi:hypothetical protein
MSFAAFTSTGITGWEADFTLKVMRRNSASRMTVQALYSGLANEFDNSTEMDDKVPMSAQTPTEFSLINGWHIPESSMDYLSGGSIQTTGYDAAVSTNLDPIYVLTASAFAVNFQSTDIGKVITDGTRSGTLLSYNNTTKKLWVRMAATGTVTWSGTLTCTTTLAGGGTAIGTLSSGVTGEDVWANFYTLGTYPGGVVFYVYQNGVLVPTYTGYSSGALDQLVKTKASNTTVDSGNVTFYARESTYLFDNFTAQASATGGRNPVPIGVYSDSNDSGAAVTGPTITFGTVSKDIGDGNGVQNYDVSIAAGGKSSLEIYRWLKQITARLAANPGTFTTLTSSSGYFYRYFNSGYTESKQGPFGTYAGGKFFGARGVWVEGLSDNGNRVLIDAAGTTRTPSPSVTVTVTGVASNDRVLVARSTGSGSNTINKSQFTLNGTHTAATSIVVNETVNNDIPSSGVIRVGDQRFTYSTLNRGTKTFGTLSGTVTAAASTPTYVPLIDDVSAGVTIASPALTYFGAFDVVYRVRKYAAGAGNSILPFENVGSVGSSDVSFSAVRTVDPVAT